MISSRLFRHITVFDPERSDGRLALVHQGDQEVERVG